MATPPGLFYAYGKDDQNDWGSRYLIVFASRAVADEWWRAIALSIRRGYTRFSHVIRHSIQFYSFNASIAHICDTLTDSNVIVGDSNLLSKVFFTLLDDRKGRVVCPAPVLNYTDHRSGDTFYVRSMTQPDIFWFYNPNSGVIKPSKNRRTKFTITIVDEHALGPDAIMIGTDRFTITVDQLNFNVLENGIVSNDDDLPTQSVPSAEFRFSEFDGGFEIKYPFNYAGEDLEYAVIFPVNGKRGDRWELV